MFQVAKTLGITSIEGKPINHPSQKGPTVTPKLPNGLNIPVISNHFFDSESPSIAFDPAYSKDGYAFFTEYSSTPPYIECWVYETTNAGQSWSAYSEAPLNTPTDYCADPVVRYSPDGSTPYFVYESIRQDESTSDLNFWYGSGPALRLITGTPDMNFVDSAWIDVHQMNNAIMNIQGEPSQAGIVYATATYFSAGHDEIALFTSTNYGSSWFGIDLYDSFGNSYVTLSRAIGGMYDTAYGSVDFLVCWYDSDIDGQFRGVFDISCDWGVYGVGIVGPVSVAHNVKYEIYEYLCPYAPPNNDEGYGVAWTSMGPSIAISPDGVAHVVFAASSYDPKNDNSKHGANYLKTNCGDIEYVRSKPFSYGTTSSWLAMKTAAGGSLAQLFPSITVQQRPAYPPTPLGYRLYLFYYDAKNSPASCSATSCYANILYDIYMRTSNNGGSSWSSDTRITDQSSLADWVSMGTHIDSTSLSLVGNTVWVIWTDRSGRLSIYDEYDEIYTQPVSTQ